MTTNDFEHDHSPEAIKERLLSGPSISYLRDWIYGGIDGAVTTFAIVSGVVGAGLSTKVIIILGFANLIADGFSMAAANYSGTIAERDEYEHIKEIEYRHIRTSPEGEKEEIRQIYAHKGFKGKELESIVEVISSDPERWVKTMLTEEYGMAIALRSPWYSALTTFLSFGACGLVALLPFLFDIPHPFLISTILTFIVFFLIGSIKSRWSVHSWLRSGLETLLIGAIAAGIAYMIGFILGGVMMNSG